MVDHITPNGEFTLEKGWIQLHNCGPITQNTEMSSFQSNAYLHHFLMVNSVAVKLKT